MKKTDKKEIKKKKWFSLCVNLQPMFTNCVQIKMSKNLKTIKVLLMN